MTPHAELIYSHDYAQRLYRGDHPFTEVWHDLVNRGEVFERVFHEVVPTILESIPVVSGYAWAPAAAALPVYLVVDGENLVAPLTLAATDDPEYILYDVVILLVRTNLQTGFLTDLQRDAAVHAIAREVIRRAALHLEDAIAASDLTLREQHGMDFQLAPWDLHAHTARHFIET